jgi:hypothetical protein
MRRGKRLKVILANIKVLSIIFCTKINSGEDLNKEDERGEEEESNAFMLLFFYGIDTIIKTTLFFGSPTRILSSVAATAAAVFLLFREFRNLFKITFNCLFAMKTSKNDFMIVCM